MDIGRLPRPCRGTKSLLPSPSNRFSSSECGAGGASNPNFTKSFRRRSVSVNRGKLSIVPKRRASWPAARWAEELCTNCGRNSREEIFGDVPDTPRFPLLIKILDAQEKLSLQVHPPENVASRLGGEPKSEFWYVAAADPDAELFLGFREPITRDSFEERLRDGTVIDHIHRIAVQRRRCRFPPGRPCSCDRRRQSADRNPTE